MYGDTIMDVSNDPNNYYYKFSSKILRYYLRTPTHPEGRIIAKRNIPKAILNDIKEFDTAEEIIGLVKSVSKLEESVRRDREKIASLQTKLNKSKEKLSEAKSKVKQNGANYEEEIRKRQEKVFNPWKKYREHSNSKPKEEYKPPPRSRKQYEPPPTYKDNKVEEYKNLLISVGIFDNPVNVNNIALYEKRWRKWIRINHPDRGGKDTELCAELINAWDHRSEIL